MLTDICNIYHLCYDQYLWFWSAASYLLLIQISGIQMLFLPCLCTMRSFNTWVKLSAEYPTGPSTPGAVTLFQNVDPLFIPFLILLQREEPLINVLHDQPYELVRTIMMRFLKESVVGEKTGKSLLSVDVDNTQ